MLKGKQKHFYNFIKTKFIYGVLFKIGAKTDFIGGVKLM